MKLRPWSAPFLLCLSILLLGARAGSSEELQPLEPQWLTEMYADGWQKVQEGVLQRDLDGSSETFAYGTEGLEWIAQGYEQRVQFLEDRYSVLPSEELADVIEHLKLRLDRLYQDLQAAPAAESFSREELTNCTPSHPENAQALPTQSPRGVRAIAGIAYEGCGQVADIFLSAYAEAIDGFEHNTATQTKTPKASSITTSASASAIGTSGCFSQAIVDVSVNGISLTQKTKDNFSCPLSPTVSITGPTQVTTDHYIAPCKDVTWNANASNGTPSYTFSWYLDGVFHGTGSSATKQYCGVDTTVAVQVVVQDAHSWTANDTTTTQIRHVGPVVAAVSGPASVVQPATCANVTWTASATGGHPGYTYSWYFGADTTLQGTGASFTKQYCNTTQTVSVKVVARDSDGHTDDATFTTQVQVPGPVQASIAGPATITTDYYDPFCQNVTWTASAVGGHPGYTYSWYFGASTAVQGTSGTFSKTYCPGDPKPLSVKVTARDSDGHTGDSIVTTTVQELGIIQLQIQGPSSVTTSTASPCVSVTWTAVPTSVGHSGFTYQWYIDSELEGTGSSLTKQYCNTSGTIYVTVLARASDRHGVTTGHSTTVTHQP